MLLYLVFIVKQYLRVNGLMSQSLSHRHREKSKFNIIFKLRNLLNVNIRVEPSCKSSIISKCKKCQQFSQTKPYCNIILRSVECGFTRKNQVGQVPENELTKCAHFRGGHPALFRKCSVCTELQNMKSLRGEKTIWFNSQQ